MTTVNPDNSISPITSSKSAASSSPLGSELNQSDFISLLVAQVKNQDPTKPMDPSQFMNQLAQFSTVNGVQELKTAFDSLSTRLSSGQSLQAAGLVGKSVLVPGGQGYLGSNGSINGQISLDGHASDVKLKIFNKFGEQIKTLSLGGHPAGDVQFKWDGFTDGGTVAPTGDYLVTADVVIGGNQQATEVFLEENIDSITLDQGANGSSEGTLLNLSSGYTVTLDQVSQIR